MNAHEYLHMHETWDHYSPVDAVVKAADSIMSVICMRDMEVAGDLSSMAWSWYQRLNVISTERQVPSILQTLPTTLYIHRHLRGDRNGAHYHVQWPRVY